MCHGGEYGGQVCVWVVLAAFLIFVGFHTCTCLLFPRGGEAAAGRSLSRPLSTRSCSVAVCYGALVERYRRTWDLGAGARPATKAGLSISVLALTRNGEQGVRARGKD